MFSEVCIYIHIHTHTRNTYINNNKHRSSKFTNPKTQMSVNVPAHIHADMRTYIRTYIPTYLPTYLHTYIHTYAHIHIHASCHITVYNIISSHTTSYHIICIRFMYTIIIVCITRTMHTPTRMYACDVTDPPPHPDNTNRRRPRGQMSADLGAHRCLRDACCPEVRSKFASSGSSGFRV